MGKKIVTETLICKNCQFYESFPSTNHTQGYCDNVNGLVSGRMTFCRHFEASPDLMEELYQKKRAGWSDERRKAHDEMEVFGS